jgi:hypothetical protein
MSDVSFAVLRVAPDKIVKLSDWYPTQAEAIRTYVEWCDCYRDDDVSLVKLIRRRSPRPILVVADRPPRGSRPAALAAMAMDEATR